jgi:hypothetical protein
MLCQGTIEVGMSISINSHSLGLALAGALIGIKESNESGMLDTVHF